MIVLGYSGLDDSVRFAQLDPLLVDGEERIVQGLGDRLRLVLSAYHKWGTHRGLSQRNALVIFWFRAKGPAAQ